MGMLGYVLLFVFVFPFMNKLMYMNPILGFLSYGLLIWSMVSANKRKRAFQNAYANQQQNSNSHASAQDTQAQQRANDKDIIDVEYTQEDV